jgi:hypothetical protein
MIDADSGGNGIPSSHYFATATSLSSLHSFFGFMRSAYKALRDSDIANNVSLQDLRAIFVSGPFPDVADPGDSDAALVLLAFALERLLPATGPPT